MNKMKLLQIVKKNGFTFEQFNDRADAASVDIDELLLNDVEKRKLGFTQLNQRRTYRILKTYKISEKLKEVVAKISKPQIWMILTELK